MPRSSRRQCRRWKGDHPRYAHASAGDTRFCPFLPVTPLGLYPSVEGGVGTISSSRSWRRSRKVLRVLTDRGRRFRFRLRRSGFRAAGFRAQPLSSNVAPPEHGLSAQPVSVPPWRPFARVAGSSGVRLFACVPRLWFCHHGRPFSPSPTLSRARGVLDSLPINYLHSIAYRESAAARLRAVRFGVAGSDVPAEDTSSAGLQYITGNRST